MINANKINNRIESRKFKQVLKLMIITILLIITLIGIKNYKMFTKQEIKEIVSASLPPRSFSIVNDNFEDGVNSSLELTTGWSVGSDGIAVSTNGGWGNSALYNKYTTIDRVSARALIQVIDASSVFCIIRKPNITSQFGTVVKVDCNAGTLSFMASWNGSASATTSVKSISIPFAIIANNKYILELRKDRDKHIAIFSDATNSANRISLIYDNEVDVNSGAGRQWGAPGIMFLSGSIKLKRFGYSSLFPANPRVLITGHSFVEGYALVDLDSIDGTYSNLLFKNLNGDVGIAGIGGETSTTLLLREDIKYFSPKFHLVDIGANDTDYSTWLANIQIYISAIQNYGAVPILTTLVPRADRQSFINSCNVWIRSSGYDYVDFAKAVTIGNDGVTMDPSLFWTDSVHPNVAGNKKMFQQIQSDAAFIFDDKVVYNGKNQFVKLGIDGKLPAIDGSQLLNLPVSPSNLNVIEVNKTNSFSVSDADKFKLYVINSAGAVTVTVPTGLTPGYWWEFLNIGAGQVSFINGGGASLISPDSRKKLRAQYSYARVIARSSGQTSLGGDIVL